MCAALLCRKMPVNLRPHSRAPPGIHLGRRIPPPPLGVPFSTQHHHCRRRLRSNGAVRCLSPPLSFVESGAKTVLRVSLFPKVRDSVQRPASRNERKIFGIPSFVSLCLSFSAGGSRYRSRESSYRPHLGHSAVSGYRNYCELVSRRRTESFTFNQQGGGDDDGRAAVSVN